MICRSTSLLLCKLDEKPKEQNELNDDHLRLLRTQTAFLYHEKANIREVHATLPITKAQGGADMPSPTPRQQTQRVTRPSQLKVPINSLNLGVVTERFVRKYSQRLWQSRQSSRVAEYGWHNLGFSFLFLRSCHPFPLTCPPAAASVLTSI